MTSSYFSPSLQEKYWLATALLQAVGPRGLRHLSSQSRSQTEGAEPSLYVLLSQ